MIVVGISVLELIVAFILDVRLPVGVLITIVVLGCSFPIAAITAFDCAAAFAAICASFCFCKCCRCATLIEKKTNQLASSNVIVYMLNRYYYFLFCYSVHQTNQTTTTLLCFRSSGRHFITTAGMLSARIR